MRYPTDNNRITSKYGYRIIDGKLDYHGGTDYGAVIARIEGDPIYSIVDNSKVVFVGYDKWRGNNIILEHNSHCTRYNHLNRVLASKGDVVHEIDIIGLMGSTGKSSAAHLHLEIHECKYENFYDKWSNGEYMHTIDPELFFARHKENHELREKLNKVKNRINEIIKQLLD